MTSVTEPRASDVPRWAAVLLLAVVAAAFVALRLEMNREYAGAPWDALVAGTAKLPFGHRVLVPVLVRPLVAVGLSVVQAFALTEWLATLAVITGVAAASRPWLPARAAAGVGLAAVPVLGLAFLLRFKWPIFYPWDTPAIACIAWGMACISTRRYGVLLVLTAVGAANRESALLLPALLVVFYLGDAQRRPEAVRWAMLMGVAAVLVRFAISVAWPDNPGSAVHLRVDGDWRVLNNLRWLRDPAHVLRILGAFSVLPLAWPVVRRFIPTPLRRIELVIVGSVLALLVVANIYEPRAFGEPLILAYLGVAVGTWRWVRGEPPTSVAVGWPGWIERSGSAVLLVGWSVGVLSFVG